MNPLDPAVSRQELQGHRTCVESDGRLLHRAQDASPYESMRSVEAGHPLEIFALRIFPIFHES
jgi:hypothetical protein